MNVLEGAPNRGIRPFAERLALGARQTRVNDIAGAGFRRNPPSRSRKLRVAREGPLLSLFLAQRLGPFIRSLLRFFFDQSVAFLQFSNELFTVPCNHCQIVVGQLAPLTAGRPFELFPFPFYLISVHGGSSLQICE